MDIARVRYQTVEIGDTDFHLRTLRDNQQFEDNDGIAASLGISSATWPRFGTVWPSGERLAKLMFDYDIEGKRILEVGCGIGLASLVLNSRRADITATDYHPEAGNFLAENAALNKGAAIPYVRADWADQNNRLGQFDLIIGSDILYESDHAELLSNFINFHAKPSCTIIIVDPGRSHRGRFSKLMEALGYEHPPAKTEEWEGLSQQFKGRVLYYKRTSD